MKRRILKLMTLVGLLGMAPLFAQPTPNQGQPPPSQITWTTDYAGAVSAARKLNKPILLFFTGSDWCGWCKKLHQEVFASPDFISDVGYRFVFVEVDFPQSRQLPPALAQQNAMLKQKFGISGYPTVVILDSNENFIAETGYRPGGGKAYAEYLKQLLS
jgi:protein disulfide-isomerase